MILWTDYETASEVELGGQNTVGLLNYAIHPSTRVLMLAYAFDNGEVKLWEPHLGPMPEELLRAYIDPSVQIGAFNSAFERYITKHKLGIDIPALRYQDPQASGRYLSLPANLEDAGVVLRLPLELQKDKRGKELLDLFSKPHTRKKKDGGGVYFNNHETHPKEWVELGEYAKQDIRAEREIARREQLLGVFPLPERERKIWILDQHVNDRGMPVDRDFVEKMFRIADRNKKEKLEEQNKRTGLKNANSRDQLLPWAQQRGYPLGTLRKETIELVLKDKEVKLTPECREVLQARVEQSSTSYKKLQAILRNLGPNNRLCNQFIYMGSSRCGRWSGNAVQLHNMARPNATFEDMENVIKARNLVYAEDYEGLKKAFPVPGKPGEFYSPLIVVKNLIRTVFVAHA